MERCSRRLRTITDKNQPWEYSDDVQGDEHPACPHPPNALHFFLSGLSGHGTRDMRLLTGLASFLSLCTAVFAIHESDVGVVDWHKHLVGVPLSGIPTTAPSFYRAGNKSIILTATANNVLAALEPANGALRTWIAVNISVYVTERRLSLAIYLRARGQDNRLFQRRQWYVFILLAQSDV